MTLVQDDNAIEAVAADGADQAFDIGILPGRARGGEHLFDTEAVHTATEPGVIDVIAIAQEISRGLVPGKCLGQRSEASGFPRAGSSRERTESRPGAARALCARRSL